MKIGQMRATKEELYLQMLANLRHIFGVEYYLGEFQFAKNDVQRSHDSEGLGNKFEIDILNGMALRYRVPKVNFKEYVLPWILAHRQGQDHHRKTNDPDPNDWMKPMSIATEDDMYYAALDAVRAMREERSYEKSYSYGEIQKIVVKEPNHKTPYILRLLPEFKKIKEPDIYLINSLQNIPNIGISKEMHEALVEKIQRLIKVLDLENFVLEKEFGGLSKLGFKDTKLGEYCTG